MKRWAMLVLCTAVLGARGAEGVLPPGASFGALSPEQLSMQWWQWVMSVPGESSPLKDPTGANCAAGQDSGPVWFLAGAGGGKVRRTCEVPAGKALFFPILQKGDRARSCDQAKGGARLGDVASLELFAEIDGVAVPNPKRYRVATENCFDVYAKVSPMLGRHEPHPSASDGYWLLVAPLPQGRHVVKYGVRFNDLVPLPGRVDQDIEYDLKVQ